MTTKTIIFAALAAAVATTGTIAFPAYASEVTRIEQVGYSDLNLADAGAAATLKARVANAARRVCETPGDRSLDSMVEAKKCSKVALAKAMPQVELALAKSGTQLAENSRVTVASH